MGNGFIKESESQTFKNSAIKNQICYENFKERPSFLAKLSINGLSFSGKKVLEKVAIGNGRYEFRPDDGEIKAIPWRKQKTVKATSPIPRKFKLKRSRIQALALAFSNLRQSKKFMAFYSISFPQDLPDETCRQILNTALTRCRLQFGRFGYLVVCERQQNGTLHFHMLVNKFMNIRLVNHFFGRAIETQLLDTDLSNINFNRSKYNGVDVRRVFNPTGCIKYLSKYLTKSESAQNKPENEIKGRKWFASNSVANLLTYLYLPDFEIRKVLAKLTVINQDGDQLVKVVRSEYFTFIPFKESGFQHLSNMLNSPNEVIFNRLST